ncbi:MAG: response regulator transcription factor [Chloroflexi bacterium]|nr:MAG: response regulator transcription factor [Chloroflexota bacterium]TMG09865.1 MAG: response regulator transcription factor [Chloroflexota bacterium]
MARAAPHHQHGARLVLREEARGRGGITLLRVNGLQIDTKSGEASRQGERLPLTRKERLLLRELAAKPGRAVSSEQMLTNVWGASYRGELPYLRVWMSRLRSKLEPASSGPALIKTVQGIGYLLDAGAEPVTSVAQHSRS